MGRVSREQAQQHREQVVATAARLFRERGADGVSVADLMAEVGLTHGGFYRQFESKDALLAEAIDHAFGDREQLLEDYDARRPGHHDDAKREFVERYLSPEHRDDPGGGCPIAGFGVDVARGADDDATQERYAEGVRRSAEWLGPDGDGLAALSTLVGALVLARATADTELSDEILAAARAALNDG